MFLAATCVAQQQANSVSPARVSPVEAEEHLIKRVLPEYPAAGIASQIQNNEILNIVIDKQGMVTQAEVKSGHPWFAQPSITAVKQWKYRPFVVNGSPALVQTMVLIVFRLSPPDGPLPEPVMPVSVLVIAPRLVDTAEWSQFHLDPKPLEERLTTKVEPNYPQMARIAHIQGDVTIRVLIDKEGHVAKLKEMGGHPILIQSAMDAVKQWIYKPYQVEGKPAEVQGAVVVHFRL
jgi:TonB family protein